MASMVNMFGDCTLHGCNNLDKVRPGVLGVFVSVCVLHSVHAGAQLLGYTAQISLHVTLVTHCFSTHRAYLNQAAFNFCLRCCCTLTQAVAEGRAVNMENFFSRLALDIIGKAVFNYDFDSLTHDDPVIEVRLSCVCACVRAHTHTLPSTYLVFIFSLLRRSAGTSMPSIQTCLAAKQESTKAEDND